MSEDPSPTADELLTQVATTLELLRESQNDRADLLVRLTEMQAEVARLDAMIRAARAALES